jgi:uncharacterized protein YlaI
MKMSYWLAIIALVGCDDPGSVDPIEATTPVDGLHMMAVITPSTFRADQMTQITVTLRNEGVHTWLVMSNQCRDRFEISTQNAEVVRPPQHYPCLDVGLPPQRIEPDSQFEHKATWRGGTRANGSLSPGAYMVGGNVYVYRDALMHRGLKYLNLRGGGTPFQIVN